MLSQFAQVEGHNCTTQCWDFHGAMWHLLVKVCHKAGFEYMINMNSVLLGDMKRGDPGVEKQFLRKFPHLSGKLLVN